MWTFGLVDMAANAPLGEIANCLERRVTFPLSRADSASFKVPVDNRFADRILETKDNVIVHDDLGVVRFNGPIVAAEETGEDDQLIAVTVGSPLWWAGLRITGRTRAGASYTETSGPGLIYSLIYEANSDGNTTIGLGSAPPAGTSVTVGPWHFKPIDEAILEVASTLGGPDFWLEYLEPGSSSVWGPQAAMLGVDDARGTDRSGSVFLEYGMGQHNMKAYKRAVTRAGLLTRAYGLPPGFPDTTEAVTLETDVTLEGTYGRAYAAVANDLIDPTMRAALLAAHVNIRKQPRQVITFTPERADSPRLGVDYDVGDLVTGRAEVNGATRFDAAFRVYQAAIDLDTEGNATPSIDVVPDYA